MGLVGRQAHREDTLRMLWFFGSRCLPGTATGGHLQPSFVRGRFYNVRAFCYDAHGLDWYVTHATAAACSWSRAGYHSFIAYMHSFKDSS